MSTGEAKTFLARPLEGLYLIGVVKGSGVMEGLFFHRNEIGVGNDIENEDKRY